MTGRSKPTHRRCCSVPHRYVLAFMLGFGFVLIFSIRSSFALVMTHVTAVNQSSATNLIFSHCPVSNTSADVTVDMRGDVMLMSHTAFYVGVAVAVLPSGIATTLVSPKIVAGVSLLLNSIITVLFPFAIVSSTPLVFISRGLEGVFDAGLQSAGFAILAAWSTETDKGILWTFLTVGFGIAPAVASVVTAVTVCFIRWDAVFYVQAEKRPLAEHDDVTGVWAIVLGMSVRISIYAVLIMEQAQYFLDSFSINIEDLGMLLLLPYILFTVASVLGGLASDKLISVGLSTTVTRKTIFITGYLSEGVCLLVLYFIHDWFPAYITLSIGTAMQGFGVVGYSPLPSDMSPQYTGLVFGVSSALSVGVTGVSIMTFTSMTSGRFKSVSSWQRTFLLCGVVHCVGCVLFGLLADASLQPWAEGSLPLPDGQQADHHTDHDHQDDDDDDDDAYEMVDSSTTSLLPAHRT